VKLPVDQLPRDPADLKARDPFPSIVTAGRMVLGRPISCTFSA